MSTVDTGNCDILFRFGVTGTLGVEKTELFGQLAPWLMGQGREKVSLTCRWQMIPGMFLFYM